MKIASIDIGTNTILLLICEIVNDNLVVLNDEIRIPRIGKDLNFQKIISNQSIDKLISILFEYKKICEDFGVEKIICCGTAPFRIAVNYVEVIAKVFKKTGISIKVLTSMEEAYLTFLGGVSNFNEYFDSKNLVVIDIGGGSTEITVGNLNNIIFSKSYEIGAVILKDKHFYEFPYISNIKEISGFLNNIFVDKLNFENYVTIAVAGTATTIASILLNQKEFNENEIDKVVIHKDILLDLINKFYLFSPADILKNFPSVVKGREDVILPGTIILYYLLSKLNVDKFYVSVRGIRYGLIIWELMNHNDGFWTKVGLKKYLSSLNG